MGSLDALVRGTEIILKNARGSIGGRYRMEQMHRDGYGYLSFYPSTAGNVEILSGKVNSRFRLSRDSLEHLGFARKDKAIVTGNRTYFELWRLADRIEYINSNPYTKEDALALSQAEARVH